MTHRTVPVEAVQEDISRPVAVGILNDLSKFINFSWETGKSDIHFSLNGSSTPIPHATMYSHPKKIRLPANASFTMTLDEEPTEDAVMTRLGPETTRYLFVDECQQIYVKPIYTPIKATLNIKIAARSREDAVDLYKQLTAKLYSIQNTFVHEINYHYFIPKFTILTLIEINDLMRAANPQELGLGQYLKQHLASTATILSDVAGNRQGYVVKENGILVQGRFTHNGDIPKPEKEDDVGLWSMSLSYEYWYDRCDLVHMQHPISIYQQEMDQRFLRIDQSVTPQATIGQSSEFADSVGSWKFSKHGTINEDWYFKQPYYDSWMIHYHPESVDPVVCYLIAVSGEAQTLICELDDVVHFTLRPYFLDYLRATAERLNVENGSLAKVLLYNQNEIIAPEHYYANSDLEVFTATELPLKDQYHCVLGLVNRLDKLHRQYWAELADHGCFFKNYIMIYYPHLLNRFTTLDETTCKMDVAETIAIIEEALTGRQPTRSVRTVNRLKLIAM